MEGITLEQTAPDAIKIVIDKACVINQKGRDVIIDCRYCNGLIGKADGNTFIAVSFIDKEYNKVDRPVTTYDLHTFYDDVKSHAERLYHHYMKIDKKVEGIHDGS